MAARERHKSTNTLVCLLQGIVKFRTTVELRNETAVHGVLEDVNGYMDIEMSDVTVTLVDGTTMHMDNFHITGKQIRYVHIPDEVDMLKTIQRRLADVQGIRTAGVRGRRAYPQTAPGRARKMTSQRNRDADKLFRKQQKAQTLKKKACETKEFVMSLAQKESNKEEATNPTNYDDQSDTN